MNGTRPSVRTRWQRMSAGARAATAAVIVVVLVNIGLALLDAATRGADQSGARSSSFSTAPTGTAAYSELLQRFGHSTSRARGIVRPGDLDPRATVIVLDAEPSTDSERRAVDEFVRAGGRLIAGGPEATEWAAPFRSDEVRWQADGPRVSRASVDGDPYLVHTDGDGSWAGDHRRSLTVERTEPGPVVLIADTSPLQNRRLDEADNAAFGIALAGEEGRRVVFIEGPHGFGAASGLDAIPGRWKVALIGGALAALLTLIAASRRLGPAEETTRRLPPPRRAYVDAVGIALARTRRPAEAVAPVQAAAREHLARRAGLPADAPPDVVRTAAAREGWSPGEIDALFAPATDRESILAAGRALARAERGAT